MDTALQIDSKEVKVTNLDKVWWQEEGISKGDVLRYYIEIAPWLLPHLRDRPLVLTRYPDGPYGSSFYQKNTPQYAPGWLRTVPLKSEKRVINYILADDVAALVWIVNSGGFEIHPFLSRIQQIDFPDYVVFDLDPMEKGTWEHVCHTAVVVRQALEILGLQGYPKMTGATGLQVYVPVKPVYTYEQVRSFALHLCQGVQSVLPHITTLERKVSNREGKLYLDYLQNVKGKTLATIYGVRPKPKAPVSTPLTWMEVEEMRVRPGDFTIFTLPERVRQVGDLFRQVLDHPQSLDYILSKLGSA